MAADLLVPGILAVCACAALRRRENAYEILIDGAAGGLRLLASIVPALIVLLTALLLKPLHALAAQGIYTLLGIVGLPVFSNYQSGFGVIAGPTGGFIIGFIIASFCVSLLKGSADGKRAIVRYLLTAILVGIPCIYLPGIFGFMLATGRDFVTAFTLVAATFIPIDLIKCTAAALLALPVNRALERGSIEN